MLSAVVVTAWMLAHPGWLDRSLDPEVRAPLVRAYAEAIVAAAHNRAEVAVLLALGWHETKFSFLVISGRCDEMPVGQRCDAHRARGAFSLHASACREAYGFDAGSDESIAAEARCAIRQLRFHANRCREHALSPIEGAFAGYATGSACHWSGAESRVRTTRRMAAELARAEASS